MENTETNVKSGNGKTDITNDTVKTDNVKNVKKNNRYDGTKNLVPMNKRSKEEVRAIASKGGINSGIARKERKTLQQMAREMLALAMDDDQIAEVIGDERLLSNGDGTFDKSVGKVMLARMIQEAQNGNVKAFETVRDTSGEKPTTNVQVETITDGDRALLEKVQARLDRVNKD